MQFGMVEFELKVFSINWMRDINLLLFDQKRTHIYVCVVCILQELSVECQGMVGSKAEVIRAGNFRANVVWCCVADSNSG